MNAGRELDALVAEKVFGAVIHWHDEPVFDGTNVTKAREPYAPYPSNPKLGTKRLPRYSTDVAAAWEVLERFTTGPKVLSMLGSMSGPMWACRIGDQEVVARTAPHAICLVALKAVGVTEV